MAEGATPPRSKAAAPKGAGKGPAAPAPAPELLLDTPVGAPRTPLRLPASGHLARRDARFSGDAGDRRPAAGDGRLFRPRLDLPLHQQAVRRMVRAAAARFSRAARARDPRRRGVRRAHADDRAGAGRRADLLRRRVRPSRARHDGGAERLYSVGRRGRGGARDHRHREGRDRADGRREGAARERGAVPADRQFGAGDDVGDAARPRARLR